MDFKNLPLHTSCLSCTYCTLGILKRPKGFKNHPCHQVNQSPLNPKEYHWPKKPFSLYRILQAITPKPLWKSMTKRFYQTYSEKTHHRPCVQEKHRQLKRLSITKSPWFLVRKDVPPVRDITLDSPSPRLSIIGHHGPQSLLRPFFPEDSGIDATPKALLLEERATILAGQYRQLGGKTLKELSRLKTPEVSNDLEELEPLRAMSLKEVTNLGLLEEEEHEEED